MKTRPTSITPYRYSTQADFASQEQPVGPTLCAVAACGLSADSRGMIANRPIARTRGRIMRTVAPCHRRLAKLLTDHLSWRGLASATRLASVYQYLASVGHAQNSDN